MAEKEMNREEGLRQLLAGKTPANAALLREITTGLDSLSDFWQKLYLDTYIPAGGSKIKFVTGHPGSGKTHFAEWMRMQAREKGFLTVSFSAKEVWLNDFREIYLTIIRQVGLEILLQGCAEKAIREMGYDPRQIPGGKQFVDLLAERGENDPMTKKTLRDTLREMFTRNPLLDNSFAQALSLLTGGILGYPVLENSNREILLSWLNGDSTLKAAQLRQAGLNAGKITKYNARHLLRSLCEVIRMGGYQGLLVTVDDLETLLKQGAGEIKGYTKLRREDAYESIRQLIDDIDSMRYVLFLFCFDRELIDHENAGLKSYQALWLRIQNEVVSVRFNRFADLIDLDRYAEEFYTPQVLQTMSERLAGALREAGESVTPLREEEVRKLLERAAFGQLGIPYMLNRTLLEGGRENG